ncbi:sugar ABC transporter substrate-binding protein [Nonomuraea sp. CA-218870]|uniref:ABC transporter substrate-binding protein n=1 Tax=Nonomuraea sp. CA-218870 TaxID=3239998 RepID=UPI003D95067B
MNRIKMRTSAFAAVAVLATSALAACGSGSTGDGEATGGGAGGAENGKVAFLMPDLASTRYEQQDKPLFEAKMKELCPSCSVIYQNADSDAAKQQQQANSALAQGVKAIVLDPVDSTAAASIVRAAQSQQVPIIAYDRPIPSTPADYYISFDNEKIGSMIAASLVEHLKAEGAEGGVLQVNGSPTDAAAGLIKKGIHSAVDTSGFKLLAEYDTPEWSPEKAQTWVSGQVTQFGDDIVGVVAANDGTASGAIAAFKAAGKDVPPVTGNDAEIAAAQRIIKGDQYNTISKPIKIVAEAAAGVAHQFMQGQKPEGKTTLYDTPSELFVPTVVTRDNIKEVLFDSGIMKAAEVCTGEYAEGCAELDIK